MHSKARQVITLQVRLQDKQLADQLFYELSESLQKTSTTDEFPVYDEAIPFLQYRVFGKEAGKTSYLERLNSTLIQCYARLG